MAVRNKQALGGNVNLQVGHRSYGPVPVPDGAVGVGASFVLRQDIPEGEFIVCRLNISDDGGATFGWFVQWNHSRPSVIDYPDGTVLDFYRTAYWENMPTSGLTAYLEIDVIRPVRLDINAEWLT